jgi:hypothetical protein
VKRPSRDHTSYQLWLRRNFIFTFDSKGAYYGQGIWARSQGVRGHFKLAVANCVRELSDFFCLIVHLAKGVDFVRPDRIVA